MIQTLHPGVTNPTDAMRNDQPHVLLIVDQFPKTLGGGERIVLKLASLLPGYGFRVSILTFAAHPQSSALISPPCPLYLLPLERTYDIKALRSALELKRFLTQQNVRIVQTFFESSDIFGGCVTKTVSDAKLIWSRRDMGILRGRKHHIAYRLMSHLPDAVFAVSEQVRGYCIEKDHINPDRVRTIYNGLDIDDWIPAAPLAKPADKYVLTTVGNIRRVKGHDVFIRAAATVVQKFPHVSFSVAGEVLEPDYYSELQTLIHDLNLTDRFQFVGGVSDLREHLAAADIFVLPSRSEGFSNAIIEAMAASLPVIATTVGGNAEAVKDGVSGLLVPPDQPEALASAILKMLSEPERAREMGIAGRRIAVSNFTVAAMMKQITGVYHSLLESQSKS